MLTWHCGRVNVFEDSCIGEETEANLGEESIPQRLQHIQDVLSSQSQTHSDVGHSDSVPSTRQRRVATVQDETPLQ
jgi:hypothetical protein